MGKVYANVVPPNGLTLVFTLLVTHVVTLAVTLVVTPVVTRVVTPNGLKPDMVTWQHYQLVWDWP